MPLEENVRCIYCTRPLIFILTSTTVLDNGLNGLIEKIESPERQFNLILIKSNNYND